VLEDGPLASGMSSMTTAHLTCVLDERYFDLERMHGDEGARLAAESHMTAINRIETIVGTEHLDCDFERLNGYLFLHRGTTTTCSCASSPPRNESGSTPRW
jgi:hypothetical protein